jgi:hypothetical protein
MMDGTTIGAEKWGRASVENDPATTATAECTLHRQLREPDGPYR